ncbi:NAD-dependent epimerase/dehydratase family protein [Geodermatophilus normandii]|uniref:GDP-L-fucose synthase n=1 Tax=Geodermatophilus normandii TaxID=1137989 RepID=A0A6P0GF86_9ACTN|nr:NAD-dependent epimerase/dehydratase family protein [Geodermatophilus normandii]NEM05902.1 NAD-dependent epimerase/dehydratase family protein [Geodermatophilus normandii]
MTDADDLAGRRILVTGGRGFLGSAVVRRLESLGAEPLAVGSRQHDLTEQSAVRDMYAALAPDMVVHAAAAVGGIAANAANPGRFLYANALMGLMVLEEARVAGVDKVVMVSTTCSYPAVVPLPMREDDIWSGKPAGVTGPYGMAKRLLHEACVTYAEQYGFSSTVLVLANLYGPGDHLGATGHVVPMLIDRFLTAQRSGAPSVTNWGTGTATREFLHVDDAARAVTRALAVRTGPEPINVGTGVETSIRQLSDCIQDIVGYTGRVEWDDSKPDGQAKRYLSVERAADVLGWRAEIDLAQGLAESVHRYAEQLS